MQIIVKKGGCEDEKYNLKVVKGVLIIIHNSPVFEVRAPYDYEGDSTEIFVANANNIDISSLNADNIENFIKDNAESVHYDRNGYGEY